MPIAPRLTGLVLALTMPASARAQVLLADSIDARGGSLEQPLDIPYQAGR